MTADRNRKVEMMGVERGEDEAADATAEATEAAETLEMDADYFDMQIVGDDSSLKEIYDNQKTLEIEAKWFAEKEEFVKILTNIKAFRVLKMPHILQSIFFLNRFDREKICEPNSNKFSWKKAK